VNVDVSSVCGEDVISRAAGLKIRELLLANWSAPELSILFSGKKIASVSFFDEAFGLLLKKGGKQLPEIQAKLKFPDIVPSDLKLLNTVMRTRLEELES
jgi:hypothetical protein